MEILPSLGIVFVAISVIFLSVVFGDYLRSEGKMTIARRIWLRMALIFACVAIGLYFLQTFLK